MKKILLAFFVFAILAAALIPQINTVYAKAAETISITAPAKTDENSHPARNAGTPREGNNERLKLESKSAALIDYNTGTVLYSYNENEKLQIASMCKIMTLILTFEDIEAGNLKLDEEIQVSANAAGMGGSQAFLESGGMYKVSELIKAITIASANDCCVAIGERVAGSEELFVDKMNAKAKELNMNNTVFTNTTGLPKPGQYSTSLDVALMMRELLKFEKYYNFSRIWLDKMIHSGGRETVLTNTNKMIRSYSGCDGGKTGFTSESGFCIAATAKRGAMRLISVVIKSPSSDVRFKEASTLLDMGFAAYTNKMIVEGGKKFDLKVKVKGGRQEDITVAAEKDFYMLSLRNKKENITVNFEPYSKIAAPVKIKDKVGKLMIYKDNVLCGQADVISLENCAKETYFDVIKKIGRNWGL